MRMFRSLLFLAAASIAVLLVSPKAQAQCSVASTSKVTSVNIASDGTVTIHVKTTYYWSCTDSEGSTTEHIGVYETTTDPNGETWTYKMDGHYAGGGGGSGPGPTPPRRELWEEGPMQ